MNGAVVLLLSGVGSSTVCIFEHGADVSLVVQDTNDHEYVGGASLRRPQNHSNCAAYPSALFTRSGDIGVSRSRTPVISATALAMAGATNGVAI